MREFLAEKDQPYRPAMAGTRHVVSAGHYLAAQAGMDILEAGGNAVDAAVGGGLALNVVESTMTGIAGL
jgi:gamma-glutamyltranspeptidase/glutathione hydrolase